MELRYWGSEGSGITGKALGFRIFYRCDTLLVCVKVGGVFALQVSCITLQICDDDPPEIKEDDDTGRITDIDKVCLTSFSLC